MVNLQDNFVAQNIICHFVSPSFKFTFKIKVVLCLRLAHSIRCSFTNIMTTQEPVGSVYWTSKSGSGYEYGPNLIRCVDGRQSKIYEVWTFGEDGVTPKVHPNACVDVGAFVGDSFSTDYLTPTWRMIPMFGRKSMNGSVKWLEVPNLLSNDVPPWTLNLLAPYANWGDRVSSTITNLGSGSGGYSGSISFNWNSPTRVLPI